MRALLTLLTALLVAACGTPCSRIAADRDALLHPAPADGPHAVLSVPFSLLDSLIAAQVAAVPTAELPMPGAVAAALPRLTLRLRKVSLEPAPADRVGLRLLVDVGDGRRALFQIHARVAVASSLDAPRGLLTLALRTEDLRSAHLTLDPGAADALAGQLLRQLPPAARLVVSRGQLAAVASDAVRVASSTGFAALIERAPRGVIASVSLRLPALPIASATARTVAADGGRLEVSLRTSLPVAQPVDGPPVARAGELALRLSGGAVAALGNQAVAEQAIPGVVDDAGRPDPRGRNLIGFGWQGGRRPLTVHAWCLQEPCTHARIGASPAARVTGDRVRVTAEGQVEQVEGPPLVELASWLGLASRPVSFAVEAASRIEVRAGDRLVALRLRAVRVDPAGVDVVLAVEP